MADYPAVRPLVERVMEFGFSQHVAARHVRYGRVRVDGRPVTEVYAPVPDEACVEVVFPGA